MQAESQSSGWRRLLVWSYERFPSSSFVGRHLSKRFYDRPVFLVAIGRSGTTVIGQALNEHPHILGSGDAHSLAPIGEAVYQLFLGDKADACQKSSGIPRAELLARFRRLAFETVVGPGYGGKYLLINRRLRRGERVRTRKCWMTNKAPLTETAAKGILELYPKARFLWLHRNGIENVESRTKFSGFREQPFAAQCRVWANGVKQFRYLDEWSSAMTVRHADIVHRREETFRDIFNHLGLEHHPGPARYAARTFVHPLDKGTKDGVDVAAALAERPPAHENWSAEQKRTFKEICGEAMGELGYEIPF